MNMVGDYEQGIVNFSVIPVYDSQQGKFLYKKRIKFNKPFSDEPQVLLAIQSIALIHGTMNSFQTQVREIQEDGFNIIVECYQKESEFNIIYFYTAFQNSDYIKVHYFFSTPTPTLKDYEYYSKSQFQIQTIGSIEIDDDFKSNSNGATVFILGAKSSDKTQDVSISASAKLIESENKVDIIASTWNNIKIESVSLVVLVWNIPNSFQGEWKGFQFDNKLDQYKDHPWTNSNTKDRFATLSCEVKLTGDKKTPFMKLYGIRGYDIREGPIVMITREINLEVENNISSASVGTMGKSKLVGAWVNAIILIDVDITNLTQEMSPFTICFIVAGSLIGVFIIFSICYLKFFRVSEQFKHKKFSNKDCNEQNQNSNSKSQTLNSMSAQSSNGLYKNQGDAITLEFPKKMQQRKKNSMVLLSKDLLTGAKQTDKNAKIFKQNTIIVEMSEECTVKNRYNEGLPPINFQQALESANQNEFNSENKIDSNQIEKQIGHELLKGYKQDHVHKESLSEIQSTLDNEKYQDQQCKTQKYCSKLELMGLDKLDCSKIQESNF